MEEFLIGAAFALVIALLAWGDQIRNLHLETLELEKNFSKGRNLDLRSIRIIIRTKKDPAKRIVAINSLINASGLKSKSDVNIIEKLININIERNNLEDKYKWKYYFVIILTHIFFISGLITYFIPKCSSVYPFGLYIKTQFIPFFACIVATIFILWFTIHINKKENSYTANLYNLMDLI